MTFEQVLAIHTAELDRVEAELNAATQAAVQNTNEDTIHRLVQAQRKMRETQRAMRQALANAQDNATIH